MENFYMEEEGEFSAQKERERKIVGGRIGRIGELTKKGKEGRMVEGIEARSRARLARWR